jgi:hypothetical protein
MRTWVQLRLRRRSLCVFVVALELLLLVSVHGAFGRAQQEETPPIASPLPLEARPANGSIQAKTLVTAFPVKNTGTVPVDDFKVTQTILTIGAKKVTGTVVGGTATISAGQRGASYGSFPSSALVPGTKTLTIVGTCNVSGVALSFTLVTPLTVAPTSPGTATAGNGVAEITRILTGPYPGPTVEADEANPDQDGWVVPIGPIHPLTHSPSVTIATAPAPAIDPNDLQVYSRFVPFISGQPANNFPIEPSGATSATGGGVILVTTNSGVAFSVTGGKKWIGLTPGGKTGLFPTAEGGFCCDQIVHYIPPPIDRFVWLMQYWGPGGCCSTNGPDLERIAVASPVSIAANVANPQKAWSFFDLTPAELSLGTDFFDYPDLSVGDNNLFVSFDDIGKGLIVVRLSLEIIKNVGDLSTIPFQFTSPSDGSEAYGSHLTQNPGPEIFWAGHNSNSSIRVFSWPDGSNMYSWQDIDIGSWPNNPSNLAAVTPAPPTPAENFLTSCRISLRFRFLDPRGRAAPSGSRGRPSNCILPGLGRVATDLTSPRCSGSPSASIPWFWRRSDSFRARISPWLIPP